MFSEVSTKGGGSIHHSECVSRRNSRCSARRGRLVNRPWGRMPSVGDIGERESKWGRAGDGRKEERSVRTRMTTERGICTRYSPLQPVVVSRDGEKGRDVRSALGVQFFRSQWDKSWNPRRQEARRRSRPRARSARRENRTRTPTHLHSEVDHAQAKSLSAPPMGSV